MFQTAPKQNIDVRAVLRRTQVAIEAEFATFASGLIVAVVFGSVAMGGWVGATSGGLFTRLPL